MHADFLAAIRDEPDDLTHRLVYADWLEENGTSPLDAARAELIRVQIAREAADPDGEEHWVLRGRERLLLAQWGRELAGPIHRLASRYWFRRGFVEWIDVDCKAWLNCLGDRQRPATVRALQLRGNCGGLRPRHLGGIDALDLRWADLAQSGPLDLATTLAGVGLRRLDLPAVWAPRLRDLLRFEHFAGLEHLGIRDRIASVERAVGDLLATPPPAGLRSLRLPGDYPDLLAAFADSPWPGQLRDLTVAGQPARQPSALGPLSRSPAAAGLRRLRLERPNFNASDGPPGPHLAGLESLEVAQTPRLYSQTGEFLQTLASLRRLCLHEVGAIECEGQLRGLTAWPRLHTFELDDASQSGDAWTLFRQGPEVRGRRLRVCGAAPWLLEQCPRLAELSAPRWWSGSAWVDSPPPASHPTLTGLDLPMHPVDPDVLRALLDRRRFPRLAWIDLRGVVLPAETVALLRRHFGVGAQLGATTAALRAYDAEQALDAEHPS